MSIRYKVLALLTLTGVLVLSMTLFAAGRQWNNYTKAVELEHGVRLSIASSNLVHELQKERGMTAGYLGSGGTKFAGEIKGQRRLVDERLQTLLEAIDAKYLDEVSETVRKLTLEALDRLDKIGDMRERVDQMAVATPEALKFYTGINTLLLAEVAHVSHGQENAKVASELISYASFLNSKERMGIERAVLTNVFAKDAFGPGLYAKWIDLMAKQEAFEQSFADSAPDLWEQKRQEMLKHPSFAEVVKLREVAKSKAETGGFGVDPAVWFDTITQKINQVKAFEDKLGEQMLEDTIASEYQAMVAFWVMLGASLLLSSALAAVAWVVVVSILRPILHLEKTLLSIAEGDADLTQRLPVKGKDEIASMAKSFNSFITRLHHMIAAVKGASLEAAEGTSLAAEISGQMSENMQAQQENAQTIAAASTEMTSTVTHIAEQVDAARQTAVEAGESAVEGGRVVKNTVDVMRQIADAVTETSSSLTQLRDQSGAIGEIVTVINDIADQTNLLALNAAIEAARAGEHGRGFAVVADEVRKLADRTTQATDEITSSIQSMQNLTMDAHERMEAGSNVVQEGLENAADAGTRLDAIVSGSEHVASLVGNIATASTEQASASEEINNSIVSISKALEDSAQLSGETSGRIDKVRAKSEQVNQLLAEMHVEDRRVNEYQVPPDIQEKRSNPDLNNSLAELLAQVKDQKIQAASRSDLRYAA